MWNDAAIGQNDSVTWGNETDSGQYDSATCGNVIYWRRNDPAIARNRWIIAISLLAGINKQQSES